MLKACIITPNYPRDGFIEKGAFVESLAQAWKSKGTDVTVINPVSLQNKLRFGWCKSFEVYNGIDVYRPSYLSFSNFKFGGFSSQSLSAQSFVAAAYKVGKKIEKPCFYYGKFLMNGGYAAMELGNKYNIHSFVDIGESKLWNVLNNTRRKQASYIINNLNGLFCVSERLNKEIIKLGANKSKVYLTPNTVDLSHFKPLDRKDCRKRLNLPQDKNIVIFVGHFIERKGPLRVLDALIKTRVDSLGVFIGKGNQQPHGDRVLFTGSVKNSELPLWLNAADLFVLPTLAEGNCNSINEALACGLPVITSNISDVRNQVNNNINGLLVNPNSIDEIRIAIETILTNNILREKMIFNNIQEGKKRFFKDRSSDILKIITNMLEHHVDL